jgi:precorrin-6B C5,15-methyltransferase / cobalt-precorrin-6B C5,C15-methyltransferase
VRRAITVIGIGADGCAGFTSRAAGAVAEARVLAGGARHLAFFPQFKGERVVIGGDLDDALDRIVALADEAPVCVLASGDPLFFGIGARLLRRVPPQDLEFLPHPTSVQWAFARAGVSWDDAAWISVHGRGLEGLAARLRRHRKVAVLTDGDSSPPIIARHLLEHGLGDLQAVLCEDLAGPRERVRRLSLEALSGLSELAPLNVLLLLRPDGWSHPSVIPCLPDEAFETRRGLITKREVRLLALGALGISDESVIWDVGAGSGSVAIEAALLATAGRCYAIEHDLECLEYARRNARRHGADNVRVIAGRAPTALEPLEPPDAVFVGGSGGELAAILDLALERLRPGGRIVVSAVTLETLEEARRVLARGGAAHEVLLAGLARSAPIAGRTRLAPLSPVHLIIARKPGGGPP